MSDLRDKLGSKKTVGAFVSCLMFSRNQAHVFHLQNDNYAKHIALGDYYGGIVDLIDSLVETYQGTNPVIMDYMNSEKYTGYTKEGVTKYFEGLLKETVEARSLFTDSDLLNIVDEIISLIKSTLYKLKRLA